MWKKIKGNHSVKSSKIHQKKTWNKFPLLIFKRKWKYLKRRFLNRNKWRIKSLLGRLTDKIKSQLQNHKLLRHLNYQKENNQVQIVESDNHWRKLRNIFQKGGIWKIWSRIWQLRLVQDLVKRRKIMMNSNYIMTFRVWRLDCLI